MLVISMAMVLSCRYNVGHIHGDGHFVVTMLVRFMTMVHSRRCNVGHIHGDGLFLVVAMLVGFLAMVLSRRYTVGRIHDDAMLFDSRRRSFLVIAMLVGFMAMVLSRRFKEGRRAVLCVSLLQDSPNTAHIPTFGNSAGSPRDGSLPTICMTSLPAP